MEIIKTHCLLVGIIVVVLTLSSVNAIPKIRSSSKAGGGDPNEVTVIEEPLRQFQSCYESIPCGYALYTTERRQPFRRISTYTRNRL